MDRTADRNPGLDGSCDRDLVGRSRPPMTSMIAEAVALPAGADAQSLARDMIEVITTPWTSRRFHHGPSQEPATPFDADVL